MGDPTAIQFLTEAYEGGEIVNRDLAKASFYRQKLTEIQGQGWLSNLGSLEIVQLNESFGELLEEHLKTK